MDKESAYNPTLNIGDKVKHDFGHGEWFVGNVKWLGLGENPSTLVKITESTVTPTPELYPEVPSLQVDDEVIMRELAFEVVK